MQDFLLISKCANLFLYFHLYIDAFFLLNVRLFTCDVCGMQFRYLKSFKKHRLNHALERLHGKKEINENTGELMVSSTNDENGIPKGIISLEDEQMLLDDQDQDDTIDSISNTNSNMNLSSNSLISKIHLNDPNSRISTDNSGGDIKDKSSISSAITECDNQETNGNITSSDKNQEEINEMRSKMSEAENSALNFAMSSMSNSFPMQGASGSLKAMMSAEAMSGQNMMGLNTQEASILNFLRGDTAEKRDKRFACPFCGKCVRSKENLKLHVRKHTGGNFFFVLVFNYFLFQFTTRRASFRLSILRTSIRWQERFNSSFTYSYG